MLFAGQSLQLSQLDNGIVELTFDLQGESVNKFNRQCVAEFGQVLDHLEQSTDTKGLLISSAKSSFIVGADITEFGAVFAQGPDAVTDYLALNNRNLNRLEDLPFPTLVCINSYALGGGCEFVLACDYRYGLNDLRIGLPETKLGIVPGWGGTVRLPRLAGLDTAIDWIASGAEKRADDALSAKVVDGVFDDTKLMREQAIELLESAAAGQLDYQKRRSQKQVPLQYNMIEAGLAFESAKGFVAAKAGSHYPAPVAAIKAMQQACGLDRDGALQVEAKTFAKMAMTPVAMALVGVFLNDQFASKKAKKLAATANAIEQAGVLGAGIMGGGIAYQSALKNIPIQMKDVAQKGLDLGFAEAAKILNGRVERGRLSAAGMAGVLGKIRPTLGFEGFEHLDVVVEAVVENPKIKQAVLSEAESHIKSDAVLASNTSTISIDYLAKSLKRPENFCGMHFFNPVHRMPLVEVIRGDKTSDAALAKVVAYANQLGKKAIVVKDCPGFLVNRILFPYFAGFNLLVRDGVDFQRIDKLMTDFGWPMGPAYLLDVVGLDTAMHAEKVLAAGYPERMTRDYPSAVEALFNAGRLGQKNGLGFYHYQAGKKGKPEKTTAPEVAELLQSVQSAAVELTDEQVLMRMMLPMATELVRCLEEGIVATPAEADLALVYGLGFPPFMGGLFKWLDSQGLDLVCQACQQFSELAPIYQATDGMKAMAQAGKTYYPNFINTQQGA